MPAADPMRDGDLVRLDAAERGTPTWPLFLVAAALFVLAYAHGGFGVPARSATAIVLWWIIVVGIALGVVPRARLSRHARIVVWSFVGFAVWTAVSAAWAPSPELAFLEFNRVSLYLALLLVALGLGGSKNVSWWLDGLRLGIVAVAVVALVSRCFPHVFTESDIGVFLPNAATRLSFPIGYWNGLAVLVALALPPSLAAAIAERTPLRRALGVAAIPLLAAVVVLASSRGGVVALLVGAIAFVAASDRRWAAAGALAVGGVGSLVAVAVLRANRTLIDGPLGTPQQVHDGRVAAVLLVIVVAATGGALVVAERLLYGRCAPSRGVGIALLVLAAVVVIVGAAAAHPIRRVHDFTRIPAAGQTAPNFTTAHLTSGSGSGRWQFWSAAVDQFESAPLGGGGAGSYRFWWAAHASFTYTLQNAHSLYLEVLAELGIVGLLLLLTTLAVAVAAGVAVVRSSAGAARARLAALLAMLLTFVVCAGIDWLWQLPVVTAVAIVALGLLVSASPATDPAPRRAGASRLALGAAALLAAWVAIFAAAVPWLTSARISSSQAAARRGDLAAALSAARDARAIQPWAATPYVQLALVAEAQRDLPAAVDWIHGATSRDTQNWSTWYLASRINREAGHRAAAAAAYARARSLNIRSPLFGGR